MGVTRLSAAVTTGTALAVAALGTGAAVLAGGPAALGVAAGAGLGMVGFWRLTRDAERACAVLLGGGRARVGWLAGAGARLLGLGAGLGALLASGWTHPVGVVVGLAVVPTAVVVQGLRLARDGRED
jgi:hypothetical protein